MPAANCCRFDDAETMIRKRPLIAIGILLVAGVAGAALVASNKFHYVDSRPAIALGDQFFSAMKERAPGKAFELYSPEFRKMQGDGWKNGFLVKMSESWGTITGYSITQGHVVPVERRGCYLLRYAVQRTKVSSEETILACPQDSPQWAIVGHELTRTDTGQHVSAGLIPREAGIHVP